MPQDHKPVTNTGLRRADLARLTGCNLETIRYYETVSLLPPPARTRAGHRSYGPEDVRRLLFIRRARDLGFSLVDVRGLLGLGALRSCAEVKERSERHLAEVRVKIADLRRIEAVLAETSARCSGQAVPDCAVLEALTAGA